jgi:predicted flap endonuclease-1-like 5' DNA nuclease
MASLPARRKQIVFDTFLYTMLTPVATVLQLLPAQAAAESAGSRWWFWLILLLILSFLTAWLLNRESSQQTSAPSLLDQPTAEPTPVVHAGESAPAMAVKMATPLVAAAPAAEPATVALEPPAAPPQHADDFTIIEGIGPKINNILHGAGIRTFTDLTQADVDSLRQILLDAGLRINNPGTWPQQAALAAAGQWDELKALQTQLSAGRRAERA